MRKPISHLPRPCPITRSNIQNILHAISHRSTKQRIWSSVVEDHVYDVCGLHALELGSLLVKSDPALSERGVGGEDCEGRYLFLIRGEKVFSFSRNLIPPSILDISGINTR